MYTEITTCRVCSSRNLTQVLSLGRQALTGVFPKSIDTDVPAGPLTLVFCDDCGLVQLKESYRLSDMYGENYGYRSGLNTSMVEHLQRKAGFLADFSGLNRGDVVLDIGSNDATLLKSYPDRGQVAGGIDPSAEKFRRFYPSHIQLATEFFSAKAYRTLFGDRQAKIVSSIAMFYDLESPVEFARDIESILDDNGIWHFEQSYMPSMVKALAYDTVCHEHLEYYGLRQIQEILQRAGLKLLEVQFNDMNGGSFAVTACKETSSRNPSTTLIREVIEQEINSGYHTPDPLIKFAESVAQHRIDLLNIIEDVISSGKKIFGLGASTKGNVLLQYCNINSSIVPYIAEVNPDKFGAFTPGSHIPIISESEAHKMRPDVLLVLPWHFRSNFIQRESKFLKDGGTLLFPLPSIEMVSA